MADWRDPAWRESVLHWADEALAEQGLRRDGEVEQPHVQWWSTALRIPTTGGLCWLKANQPPGAFEGRLTTLLARLRPRDVVEVLATDHSNGWLLTRDAGRPLREVDEGPALEQWEDLLARYAVLQQDAAPQWDAMHAMGLPDHGARVLPAQVASALEDPAATLLGRDDGLNDDEHAALARAEDEIRALCEALADSGIPETVQHDDLHGGNVLVASDGSTRLFDWGDACLSHPFHTLVVMTRALAYRYQLEPGGPEIRRLRDAYLEPWTSYSSRSELVATADVARRTGNLQRAMAWRRTADAMPPEVRREHVDAVPYGLRLFLRDVPLGGWDDGTF